MSTEGRTRWIPRGIHPVRDGVYECRGQISRALPCMLYRLKWDGKGFLVPFPMIVHHWRGMTKKAHRAALSQGGGA